MAIYILTEDDSLAYLEGAWDRADVEERVTRELLLAEVTEPTAVLLSDRSAVAFYTAQGEVI
jgi:hypothetical protein